MRPRYLLQLLHPLNKLRPRALGNRQLSQRAHETRGCCRDRGTRNVERCIAAKGRGIAKFELNWQIERIALVRPVGRP